MLADLEAAVVASLEDAHGVRVESRLSSADIGRLLRRADLAERAGDDQAAGDIRRLLNVYDVLRAELDWRQEERSRGQAPATCPMCAEGAHAGM